MPRKNRRAPEPVEAARVPQSAGPTWALAPGFDVRRVSSDKPYRCPGCDHEIRAGVWHLVVVPQDQRDERRHWHTECWRSELRRARGR
ncbi:MAG: hypothetical protein E6G55_01810 [Actinobacteria bacterium]|nr:MAG: hypothetical protein E6G61_00615 [Actinomycetota bacterium]TMK48699.1 MAG: hypothetical protein E6G55_01810 [Actinomycetota bacterium]